MVLFKRIITVLISCFGPHPLLFVTLCVSCCLLKEESSFSSRSVATQCPVSPGMALPKGETDKELLRLKARVAELEAELRTIKNVDEGNSNVVSTASEADDSSSSSSDDEEPVEKPTLVPETASNVFATENPIPMDGVVQYEERIEYDASDLLEEYTVLPQSLQSDIELSQVLHEQTVEEDEQGEPSTSASSIRRKK